MPESTGQATADKPPVASKTAAGETFVSTEDKAWFESMLNKPDLSAEDRQALISKFHGYDKGFKTLKAEHSQKLQELSSYEQEIKQVAENLKAASSPSKVAQAKIEGGKLLDKIMSETTDPQTRESLRDWRNIIQEETDIPALKKELTELRTLVSTLAEGTRTQRSQELSHQVSELSKTYGELADSYRDRIEQLGTQYPQFSAEELLFKLAKPDELRQAVVVNSRKQPSETPDRTRKLAAPSITGSQERLLGEQYKGKTAADTVKNYRELAREAVRRAYEIKGLK